ncbi:uncharacterized protein LOC129588552 [Paramacrobiotus metropolitanus]|uniref:uncharacterized protein LOC129588552 n=1 Tax=Paramacrobiotus metropolitanus TaxID=2943436 RepID=UPI0024459285|nr:uncharacterized protein LOC129588552 [Paramacrobiotus metropolitanus]XP_055338808.1 uncharacterized protein LOC129588552 [Paramacrobiotus metropolitanus]
MDVDQGTSKVNSSQIGDVLVPPYWLHTTVHINKFGKHPANKAEGCPQNILNASYNASVLPEQIVIQEIMWMLHGWTRSSLFALDVEDVWTINTLRCRPNVSQVSQDVVVNVLQEFCKYATKAQRTRRFLKNATVSDAGDSGKRSYINRLFIGYVREFIDEFDAGLERLKERLVKSLETEAVYGLMHFRRDLEQPFGDLEFVWKILDQLLIPLGGDISGGMFMEYILVDFLLDELDFIWRTQNLALGKSVWKILSLTKLSKKTSCAKDWAKSRYSDMAGLITGTEEAAATEGKAKPLPTDPLSHCSSLLFLHFRTL